jgi:hypothetical protein
MKRPEESPHMTMEKQTTFKTEYHDYEDNEADLKHDRREQLMTSNAFDNMVSNK